MQAIFTFDILLKAVHIYVGYRLAIPITYIIVRTI